MDGCAKTRISLPKVRRLYAAGCFYPTSGVMLSGRLKIALVVIPFILRLELRGGDVEPPR